MVAAVVATASVVADTSVVAAAIAASVASVPSAVASGIAVVAAIFAVAAVAVGAVVFPSGAIIAFVLFGPATLVAAAAATPCVIVGFVVATSSFVVRSRLPRVRHVLDEERGEHPDEEHRGRGAGRLRLLVLRLRPGDGRRAGHHPALRRRTLLLRPRRQPQGVGGTLPEVLPAGDFRLHHDHYRVGSHGRKVEC